MMQKAETDRLAGQFLTGLSFIIVPVIFVFAFSVHPNLLAPRFLPAQGLIDRAHHADLLQFAHVLVTLCTVPLVALALHFRKILSGGKASWLGLVGGVIAITGVIFLAVDKGALCLTMSAFDTLPEPEFQAALPAMMALFNHQGWMILTQLIMLISIGFACQAIGLLRVNALPKWQSVCFLVGVLLIGTPDGMEIINLGAAVLLGLGLVPTGVRLIRSSLIGNLLYQR